MLLISATAAVVCLTACRDPEPAAGPPPVRPPEVVEDGPATLLWAREIHNRDGFGSGFTPQPLDGGQTVAFLHDGDEANRLYHLDSASGAVIDSFFVDAPSLGTGRVGRSLLGPVRIGDDYLSDVDRWLFRIDLTDGVVRWLDQSISWSARLATDQSAIYGATFGGLGEIPYVVEIDTATGARVDSFAIDGYDANDREGNFSNIITAEGVPGVDGRVVFASNIYVTRDSGSYDRNWVQAIRWSDKSVLWRRKVLEGHATLSNAPIYYDGLYILPVRDTITAFDAGTGEVRWKYTPWTESYEEESLSVRHFMLAPGIVDDEGRAYFGSTDRYLACVDAATGRQIWRRKSDIGQGTGKGFQITEDGLLLRTHDGGNRVYVHDRYTGALLATLPKVTNRGWIHGGCHYDAATRRVYFYDGARALCYRLNFEPPG